MQIVEIRLGRFRSGRRSKAISAESEDHDKEEGSDEGEDEEEAGVYQGAGEEVDEGFEDGTGRPKRSNGKRQIQREVLGLHHVVRPPIAKQRIPERHKYQL